MVNCIGLMLEDAKMRDFIAVKASISLILLIIPRITQKLSHLSNHNFDHKHISIYYPRLAQNFLESRQYFRKQWNKTKRTHLKFNVIAKYFNTFRSNVKKYSAKLHSEHALFWTSYFSAESRILKQYSIGLHLLSEFTFFLVHSWRRN